MALKGMRWVLLSSGLLLWAGSAHASTVAILIPSSSSPALTEALSRIRGELLSVGLEVKTMEGPTDRDGTRHDPRAWIKRGEGLEGLDAVVEIVGDVTPVAVDVWVIEHSPRRVEGTRVSPDLGEGNVVERLAIRAVELLRSTFLEHDMAARARREISSTKPAVTTPTPTEMPPPTHRLERFGVEAGAAVLTSLDGVGPAILPLARFDWAARPWFVLQATLAGLGTHSTVASSVGSAQIAQQFGELGASYRLWPDRPLEAFLSLSAGALHFSIDGRANSPAKGHSLDHWSFMLDGSAGAILRLPERYFFSLAAHAQMAETYVAVYLADVVVATAGRPNLAMSLTLGAWL